MNPWFPESWQHKTAQQQAIYSDPAHLDAVVQTISRLPPLVTPWEVDALKGWMQSLGLEWAYRMAREPRRLGYRYLTTNPHAIYLLLTASGQPKP